MKKHYKKTKAGKTPKEDSYDPSSESEEDFDVLLPDTSASRKAKSAAER